MTTPQYLKLYAATALVFFALDMLWLGGIAKGFYKEQMGHLMRADVQWLPALLFYAIYVAAILALCVRPALEHESLKTAITLGAIFGLAAYAAFDLTSLALLKDFPAKGAIVDLIWGTVLTGTVAGASFTIARMLTTR